MTDVRPEVIDDILHWSAPGATDALVFDVQTSFNDVSDD